MMDLHEYINAGARDTGIYESSADGQRCIAVIGTLKLCPNLWSGDIKQQTNPHSELFFFIPPISFDLT
jgi:hypothetical protein